MDRSARAALLHRRDFLYRTLIGASTLSGPLALVACGGGGVREDTTTGGTLGNGARIGPLLAADANGVRLPANFSSRIVARAGAPRAGDPAGEPWHAAPDGGAVFAQPDGGWIYASNSEIDDGRGGVGALRFDAAGELIAQYAICRGTSRNCAGGATPWGTWLSCEEVGRGQVWECWPDGSRAAAVRPALGTFRHEAVAVDTLHRHLYMTEDTPQCALFRFVPAAADWPAGAPRAALADGRLQMLAIASGPAFPPPSGSNSERYAATWIDWPAGAARPPGAAPFDGGEGIWFHGGSVFFATKGDDRVWRLDTATQTLSVFYDDALPGAGALTGVDNVVGNAAGDLFVAEDGGNQEIVALTPGGAVIPILQVSDHGDSELTGPAFSPDGTRLYFSSQRGPGANGQAGVTYEVRGPFVVR